MYNYLCNLFSMIYVWVSSCVYIGLNFVFICMGVFQEKYLEYLEYLSMYMLIYGCHIIKWWNHEN